MKVGDKLKDNDPRMNGRVLTIVALGVVTTHGVQDARARDSMGRERWYSAKRIHADGKPRRGGFDLLPAAARGVEIDQREHA